MKRHNNLFQEIISIENLQQADINARKGKMHQSCIKRHDKQREEDINMLHNQLKNKTYKTSEYTTFEITDPKVRIIYRLPYLDRIVQHAIMIKLESIFVSTFTADTYSCIKDRGTSGAFRSIKKALKDEPNTKYCLKIDVKKFYPSIDHDVLKQLLRRKIKDKDLLLLLDGIIDSADGVPIGNYLSQYFANFYLSPFDHWIKEVQMVLNYTRYADDMIFFSGSKEFLHNLLANIKKYLWDNLKLVLNKSRQIFPIASKRPGRGLDAFGYVFFREYTEVRKTIKQKFARMLKKCPNQQSIASYLGCLKHGNCINLANKLVYAPRS